MELSTFQAFLQIGFEHIFNLNAYDHLAFIVALSAVFTFKDWRNVVLLATAFTIGHSITLALAVLEIIPVNETLIEALIPITILFTSLANFGLKKAPEEPKTVWFSAKNAMATGIGLIHGMGFSNYLKQLLGNESKPVLELFSFNIGLETGQILIVLLALVLNSVAVKYLPQRIWVRIISGITALVSVYILAGMFAG